MLTLEYLPEGSPDCPLIRMFGYEAPDLAALRAACDALAEGSVSEVSLEKQPWVRAIAGIALTLTCGPANRGASEHKAGRAFVMEYTAEGWREVSGKLTPFLEGSDGFQWLTNEGDIAMLISRRGDW